MASLPAKLLFFSLTFLLAYSLIVECRRTSQLREFDYFALALQWPGTVCRSTRHCCSSNACCRGSGAPSQFTIHGLWADYNDGTWPACCTNSRFDIKEVSNLVDALKNYWPSLSCGSPSSCSGHKGSFWAHEWEKHGTCSSPVIRNEYDYFLTTLNVYFKYNVTQVLNEAGYVPSNSDKYPLGGIISAIENAFHASPLVICSRGAVEELRLCFYKDFKGQESKNKLQLKFKCNEAVALRDTCNMGMQLHSVGAASNLSSQLFINIVFFSLHFLMLYLKGNAASFGSSASNL